MHDICTNRDVSLFALIERLLTHDKNNTEGWFDVLLSH